jgi:hypothetical protein
MAAQLGTPRGVIAMPTSGGSLAMALKYENGATFVLPSAPTEDTSAIGRGTTAEMMKR